MQTALAVSCLAATFALGISACASLPIQHYTFEGDQSSKGALEADAKARAVGRAPLNAAGPDELRVWSVDYLAGTGHGYIAVGSVVVRCKFRQIYGSTGMDIVGSRCSDYAGARVARSMIELLPKFADFDGTHTNCVFDGGGHLIDGVYKHKRFTLTVDNADVCSKIGKGSPQSLADLQLSKIINQ